MFHCLKNIHLEIAAFLELARSFIFKVRNEAKAAKFDVACVSYKKRYCQRHEIIKTPEFISRVDKNTKKSMRALARELQVEDATNRCVIHEDLR